LHERYEAVGAGCCGVGEEVGVYVLVCRARQRVEGAIFYEDTLRFQVVEGLDVEVGYVSVCCSCC